MKKNNISQKSIAQKIVQLNIIKNKYKNIIRDNPQLKNDFEELLICINTSNTSFAQSYKKIINHIISEMNQSDGDNQRISDESPIAGNDALQQYVSFKQTLEDYYADNLCVSEIY